MEMLFKLKQKNGKSVFGFTVRPEWGSVFYYYVQEHNFYALFDPKIKYRVCFCDTDIFYYPTSIKPGKPSWLNKKFRLIKRSVFYSSFFTTPLKKPAENFIYPPVN